MTIRHKIRTGRDVDQNIYMQAGDEPRKGDLVIGHICHAETAHDVVNDVNAMVERRKEDPLFPKQGGVELREFASKLLRAAHWSTEQSDPAPDWDGLLREASTVIELFSWHVDNEGRVI
jgi:hypothetical protein